MRTYVGDVTVQFNFEHSDGRTDSTVSDFDPEIYSESDFQEYADKWLDAANETCDEETGEWELYEWEVVQYDTNYANPNDFASFDDYKDYCELVGQHGEAYHLRWNDVGEHDFDDEYNGCWGSEEEFAQDLFEQCYDIPDFVANYIDYDRVTRDIMMDYSVYHGSDGVHIFRC